MERMFSRCPSCGGRSMHVEKMAFGATCETCMVCAFVTSYVVFTCGCCNPDVFAICPNHACRHKPRGTPTHAFCNQR